MRIAHIADVHIRGLSRHGEYRTVFEQFAREVRAKKVDVIFVGGDIFHTKTSGITPEYIDFMRWWLTELASAAPLHMILGNHDGNLVNASRQDAVTPIIEALADPRIRLYKKSGVYEFSPGWNWCVYSLFDKESWSQVRPEEGKINIACYHGGVRSSITETGWSIEEGPSVDFFDGYDLCLLGDIHRQQFLGEERDGKPWIAYPGTPVCQNYAEGEQAHGYLVWDLDQDGTVSSVEFCELEQPAPYVTIDWLGDIEGFEARVDEFKKGSRFRVRSDIYISQDDILRIGNILKFKKDATEFVLKADNQGASKDVFSAGGLEMMKDDLRNVEVLMLLLRDFYQSISITESEWSEMSVLIEKYLRAVTGGDDVPRHKKWSVKALNFDNLFTYGKGNVVNFEKLKGVVGVFGPNRCGKSSIVGALMYALFNSTDRGSIKNLHVVNARKAFAEAKVELTIDDSRYVISRETNKSDTRRGETVAATDLAIEVFRGDGASELLTGEQRTDTEKVIRRLIGTQDDFLLTSMSTQGDLNRFIDEGSSFRKLILTKFLDLDIFEKMHDVAKKDVSTTALRLRSVQQKSWDEERKRLSDKVKAYDELQLKMERKLEELRDALQQAQVKIALHQNVTPVSQAEVDQANEVVASHKHRHEALLASFERVNRDDSELLRVREELATFDIASLVSARETGQALKQTLQVLKHRQERTDDSVRQLEKSVKRLEVVPCGDKFPTCMFIKDSHSDRDKLPAAKAGAEELRVAAESAEAALANWEEQKIEQKIARHGFLHAQERKLADRLHAAELEVIRITSEIDQTKKAIAESEQRVVELQEIVRQVENKEIIAVRADVVRLQGEVKKFDKMKLDAAAGRGKIHSEVVKLDQEEAEWRRLNGELRLYELISNAFSKRGVPTRIINSQLPAINIAIAEVLHGVADFTIEMVADEESNAMEVYLNYGDSKRIIELCSGMEKMFAALAIRVALHRVTSLPKTDIFIIDEGFGVLDETNIEACNRLLTSLKKYFNAVIVITHVDAVKDVADMLVEITRDGKESKVVLE